LYVKLDALEQSLANQRFKQWMGKFSPPFIKGPKRAEG
jgi:hypothetical protein